MEGHPCLPLLDLFAKPFLRPAQPDDASLFREGEILFSKGNLKKPSALQKGNDGIPKSPLLNEAKFRMGICYTQLKRPKDAIRILNELLPLLSSTENGPNFYPFSDNYFELKDRPNALHWYGKAILVSDNPR